MAKVSASDSRGFTLVEVLMAMLIMTVGLLGLLQSMQVAYQNNARNKLREEAVQLAEEQMNDFRQMSFGIVTANRVIASISRTIAGGSRNFNVMRNSESMGTDSRRLTVEVAWTFKNVTAHHVIYAIKNR